MMECKGGKLSTGELLSKPRNVIRKECCHFCHSRRAILPLPSLSYSHSPDRPPQACSERRRCRPAAPRSPRRWPSRRSGAAGERPGAAPPGRRTAPTAPPAAARSPGSCPSRRQSGTRAAPARRRCPAVRDGTQPETSDRRYGDTGGDLPTLRGQQLTRERQAALTRPPSDVATSHPPRRLSVRCIWEAR